MDELARLLAPVWDAARSLWKGLTMIGDWVWSTLRLSLKLGWRRIALKMMKRLIHFILKIIPFGKEENKPCKDASLLLVFE